MTTDIAPSDPGRSGDRPDQEAPYQLRLYVAGATPASARAIASIQIVCQGRLAGRCELEIIDVNQLPGEARRDNIIATPTLVKAQPHPVARLIGDLGDQHRVLAALGIVED